MKNSTFGDKTIKKARRSMLWMRVSNVIALVLMVTMVSTLYIDQNENKVRIQSMIDLAGQFSKVSNGFSQAVKRARIIAKAYSPDAQDVRIAFMDMEELRKFYKTAAPEAKIQIVRNNQIKRMDTLNSQILVMDQLWENVSDEFRLAFKNEAIFADMKDPFKSFKYVTDDNFLKDAKAEAHMYHAAQHFIDEFDEMLEPQIIRAQGFLKSYMSTFIENQTREQSSFLIQILIGLACLALFVFVPVDIIMRRLFAHLNDKTVEAKEALLKAQAADKAKTEFLATMSHEIRTPMNGVLGMAELLSKTDLDTRQKTFADIIVKSGNALLTIINDVLDFSKIEAAQLSLVNAPFNIIEAVEDVGALMSSNAAEKDFELIIGLDPQMPEFVKGDSGRLRQVLTNLIGNAVKFTEKGHVLVKTSCKKIDDDPDNERVQIRFEIIDTGIGIPEDQIQSVFEKFNQVDGSKTRKHEGTGLGLAISARLVSLMGDNIRVTSQMHKGSTFSFTIELPVENKACSTDDSNLQVCKDARILVIDDNEINRTIMTEHCANWGYDCVAVESGGLGIQFLEYAAAEHQAAIDLIVLDFHMPEMSGADVAHAIRQNPMISDTPILILSSVDQADELDQLADFKIEGHLSKPARSKLLQSTINSIVAKRRSMLGTDPLKGAAVRYDEAPVVAHSQSSSDVKPEAIAAVSDNQERSLPELASPKPALLKPVLLELGADCSTNDVDPRLTILVAEDNLVNQIVFTEALKQLGKDFELANDGREAVDLWREKKPRIIVMDVSMPNMNGHEATREIRRIEAEEGLDRTPIIAVTAHAMASDRQHCEDAGMDDYMTKPISPDMLNAKISQWLGDEPILEENQKAAG